MSAQGREPAVADRVVPGVEVPLASGRRTLTVKFTNATLTESYVSTLEDLTGTINDATFKGRESGEVLFEGATGSQRSQGDPVVTFHFNVQKNVNQITYDGIDGDIVVPGKLGHHFIWVYFVDTADATAKRRVQQPKAAYVHEVLEFADFAQLGIGT